MITEEGIVGAGSSILVDELMENGTNGYGIVFMDEFDKKLIPSFAEGANTSAAVQNQLLTIIESVLTTMTQLLFHVYRNRDSDRNRNRSGR